jgi:hypothetical protein
MKKLKHEGYKRGDWIRSYDFAPIEGRPDRYVEGFILDVNREGTSTRPHAHYTIRVTIDTAFKDDPRDIVYVPMEVLFMEFNNRVSLIMPTRNVSERRA